MAETLDDGDFNCLTATVVYLCAARRRGLRPTVWATPTHVFCKIDEDQIEIEPTARSGRRNTNDRRAARRISDLQLVARVSYNRGVHHLDLRRFAEARDEFLASRLLDPGNPIVNRNLATTLNNWALLENRRAHYDRAVELLLEGMRYDPELPHLRKNDLHVHQQWVRDLCRQRKYEQALRLLDRAHQRRPKERLFDEGRVVVMRLWARDLAANGKQREAARLLRAAQQAHPEHRELDRDLEALR